MLHHDMKLDGLATYPTAHIKRDVTWNIIDERYPCPVYSININNGNVAYR